MSDFSSSIGKNYELSLFFRLFTSRARSSPPCLLPALACSIERTSHMSRARTFCNENRSCELIPPKRLTPSIIDSRPCYRDKRLSMMMMTEEIKTQKKKPNHELWNRSFSLRVAIECDFLFLIHVFLVEHWLPLETREHMSRIKRKLATNRRKLMKICYYKSS